MAVPAIEPAPRSQPVETYGPITPRGRRRSHRRVAVGVLLTVMLVLGSFVSTQIQISQAAGSRAEVDAQLAAEEASIESLRADVAALQSPARIMDEARRM